jgi:hypothetical protein
MWPFSRAKPPAAEPEPKNLRERVDDVEDAVEHLGRRFTRLEQQVTRWARAYDDDDAEDGDDFNELLEQKRRANG